MSDVIDFKPKAEIEAAEQLKRFILWARATLPKGVPGQVHEGIRWDMNSWHSSGVNGASFTALGSPRNAKPDQKRHMQPSFAEFVKAFIVHRRVFQRKNDVKGHLYSLRALEEALLELTQEDDVTQVSAVVLNRAAEVIQAHWTKGNSSYVISKNLERIIDFLNSKGLLAKPFRWKSPIRGNKTNTLKQQRTEREKKLPSRDSLLALGELFNNKLESHVDIVVTSASALLLSQPSRVGELADVEDDPIVYMEGENGEKRMFLRWHSEKGFGATVKPVIAGMEPIVKRLIERMLPISAEARVYAAWLEDHPDEFPPDEGVPNKGLDDPLTYAEACSALKISVSGKQSYRSKFKANFLSSLTKKKSLGSAAKAILNEIQDGWDTGKGKQIYVKDMIGCQEYIFDDKAVITLRKLNILMREKYLPKYFPYTTAPEEGKARVKYRDALFTVFTGQLNTDGLASLAPFGVEIGANPNRMTVQLSSSGDKKSIFERHGYKGVKVNTHAFRHELNTEMHRAGLSQLLIDAFSGRTSMGSVYNHETVEERTQAVAAVHPKTKQSNATKRLEMIRTNRPLSLSDVTDLAEGAQDRVIHQTHVGLCVHNFASEPCPKMGSCLSCGNLACVKGNDEKLKNLKEERDYLKKRHGDALAAESQGVFGASEWVTKVRNDLLKCDALIRLLENPDLENGAIVWNADNGWNLTNNAAAMAGLVDPQVIEANAQEALTSLDELSAMMDEIEV